MSLPAIDIPLPPLPIEIPLMLHSPVVHFAVALPVILFLVEIINLIMKRRALNVTSTILIILIGVVFFAAFLTGTTDGKEASALLSAEGREELGEHKLLGIYLVYATAVLLLFKFISMFVKKIWSKIAYLVLLIAFIGLTFLQGKHGGELVFEYGANVKAVSALKKEIKALKNVSAEESVDEEKKEEVVKEESVKEEVKEEPKEETKAEPATHQEEQKEALKQKHEAKETKEPAPIVEHKEESKESAEPSKEETQEHEENTVVNEHKEESKSQDESKEQKSEHQEEHPQEATNQESPKEEPSAASSVVESVKEKAKEVKEEIQEKAKEMVAPQTHEEAATVAGEENPSAEHTQPAEH